MATLSRPENPGLLLRPLAPADLPAAHALSAALRWPHRLEDWAFALALGEGLAAEREGRLVGTAMGWRHGPGFATLGSVIVDDAMQGRGIGRRLTQGVLDRLGEDCRVLLHATEAGAPLYRSLGFRPALEIRQHNGLARAPAEQAAPAGLTLRPVRPQDAGALVALDAEATGTPRAALLHAVLPLAEGVVLERGGMPAGFALIRPFGRGEVVGPVVAPGVEAARLLIGHWLAARAGRFLRLDVPAESGLGGWLAAHGLAEVGAVAGMVRGAAPRRRPDLANYALVSQALG
ncbi:GNAT family N-acetyltransferase [Pseudoroseomonas rhizosphaerae]|uniref:GNAT family N-acetyltransferase n=1 Tax=Teichococcus rhizosphaerae TaxID=1335062 RepID=A0A2C7AAW6_9PROT|nr:GNAT family N-acetyltransferase [Pseudoroseomonas rhizosphaerae]PHK95199.1 GNAT family N-acetyltransferase [Pseudoroseomonas rhizosphaerae]